MAAHKLNKEKREIKVKEPVSVASSNAVSNKDEEAFYAAFDILDRVERGLHDDYDDMTAKGMEALKTDPTLKTVIVKSKNPAKKLYEIVKKIAGQVEDEKKEFLAQGSFTGGESSPKINKVEGKLTDLEIRVARAMGVPPEKYYANKLKMYGDE
jgi:hypothetical protein